MEKRWESHVKTSLKNDKLRFQKAIRKYPLDSWIHEILEEVETREEANIREIHWIAHFQSNDPNAGYNMTLGGEGGQTSSTEELSKRMKGIPKSIQHRQNMCIAQQQYWLDNPDSAEAKRQYLIERNKTPKARQASHEAQKRRWEKWHAENPKHTKQLLTKAERKKITSEAHKGLKYKTRKDKGTKRGPLKSSVSCQKCGQTMKFITKRHKCLITSLADAASNDQLHTELHKD